MFDNPHDFNFCLFQINSKGTIIPLVNSYTLNEIEHYIKRHNIKIDSFDSHIHSFIFYRFHIYSFKLKCIIY